MIRLRAWQWTLLVIAAILVVLLYACFKLPLSLLWREDMQRFGITDLSNASLSSGHLWLGHDDVSGLVEVNYRWCPINGLGTWCMEVESEAGSFDAQVAPRPSSLSVSDAHVHRVSQEFLHQALAPLLGPFSKTVDGNIQGEIEFLRIASYECPMQNLRELSAQLEVSRFSVAGASIGDHQIVARNLGQAIEVDIGGTSIEGKVNLEGGSYEAEGQLLASPQIESVVRSLMSSLGDNRYGWEIKGSIPC